MIHLTASRCRPCIVAACLLAGCIDSDGPTPPPATPPPPDVPGPKALSIRKAEPDAEVYKDILKGLGIEPITFRCTGEGDSLSYKVDIDETIGSKREGVQRSEGSFGVAAGDSTISFIIVPPSTGSKDTKIIVHHAAKGGSATSTLGLSNPLWFGWKSRSLRVESPVGDQPVMMERGKEIALLRYEAKETLPSEGKQESRELHLNFSVKVGENLGTTKK